MTHKDTSPRIVLAAVLIVTLLSILVMTIVMLDEDRPRRSQPKPVASPKATSDDRGMRIKIMMPGELGPRIGPNGKLTINPGKVGVGLGK